MFCSSTSVAERADGNLSRCGSLRFSPSILIRRQTVDESARITVIARSTNRFIRSQAARFPATYLINDRIVRIEMALEGTYSLRLSFVSQSAFRSLTGGIARGNATHTHVHFLRITSSLTLNVGKKDGTAIYR